MKILRWLVVNGLFMAFFILENSMPAFAFNGGFFIVWLFTIAGIILFSGCILTLAIAEDDKIREKANIKMPKKSKWYYYFDASYDLVMIFVLAGMGHYVYAVFYAASHILMYIFRSIVQTENP